MAFEPLKIEGARDFSSIGPPPMLIDSIIPVGSITLVTGAKYTGKTFFALEAARAVATGTPFMGKWPARRGNVLIIEQDSPRYDTGRALWAMLHDHFDPLLAESEGHSLIDGLYVAWHPDLNLMVRADAMRVVNTAKGLSTWQGGGVYMRNEIETDADGRMTSVRVREEFDNTIRGASLIVLDSSRALNKGDENDSGEMETFIQNIKFIRQSTAASIILIAHDSATGEKTRGSTAIDAGVDNEYAITKRKKMRDTGVFVRKARAISPPEFRYEITTIEEDSGLVTKRVTFKEYVTDDENGPAGPDDASAAGRDMLFAFVAAAPRKLSGEGGLQEWAENNGVKLRTLERWLSDGVSMGYLIREEQKVGRVKYASYKVKGA